MLETAFSVDRQFGVTEEEIALARRNLDQTTAKVREEIGKLGPGATAADKLRVIHTVVHQDYGWGVEGERSYAHGIATRKPDCDVFCMIFQEVGREVGLPLKMVATMRPDGKNHAFVTYQDGTQFIAIETRANPAEGGQVLHPSELELVRQFEKANNMPLGTTPIYALDENRLRAVSVMERRGHMLPADFQGGAQEFIRLIDKGSGLTAEEQRKLPMREVCQIALRSGRLSAGEAQALISVVDHRDRLFGEVGQLFPEHPDYVAWTKSCVALPGSYIETSRQMLERGVSVRGTLEALENAVAQMNERFAKEGFPFRAQIGGFDQNGQNIEPFAVTFVALNAGKSCYVPNITGDVELRTNNTGVRFIVLPNRDPKTGEVMFFALVEDGQIGRISPHEARPKAG